MSDIKVSCDLTEKQYRNYMFFHVLGKKKDLLIHLLWCLLILFFGLSNFHVNSPILGWVFTIAAIYLFVSRYLRFFMSVNRISEQYGLSDTPKHFYTIVFQSTSFQIRNQKEVARYTWKEIFHVYIMEQRNMIYLYMNKDTAFLLPYVGIENGTIDQLKTFLSEKLPAEKITVRQ